MVMQNSATLFCRKSTVTLWTGVPGGGSGGGDSDGGLLRDDGHVVIVAVCHLLDASRNRQLCSDVLGSALWRLL